MNELRFRAARFAVPALAVTLAALGIGTSSPAHGADQALPALSLVTATADQTLQRYPGEPVDLYGLAVYLVANNGPVEFRTGRAKYNDPVSTTLTTGRGADRKTVALPDGVTRDVNVLTDMLQVKVVDARGKRVLKQLVPYCPGGYQTSRARPDAPATSPYPQFCGAHPFAVGSVFGIQDGWSVPAPGFGWYGGGNDISFDGKDGTYTVSVRVTSAYRKALGMTKDQAIASVKVTVVTGTDESGMRALSAAGTRLHPAAHRPAVSTRAAFAAAANDQAPDLRSLPAYGIRLTRHTVTVHGTKKKRSYIDFGATVWNAGPSPLVVDGFRRPGEDLMDAYQYFFDGAGNQVGSAPAGTLEWDPRKGHQHWHFTAFASYQLLNADRSLAVRSGKEAFCLAPTDPIDLRVENANWKPYSTGLETACGDLGALGVREALDVGWGDTYDQSRPGQSFNVTNLPSGTYYIKVQANPDGKLVETNTANNTRLRKVKLGGTPGKKRTLKVIPFQGVKD